ncbi:MAG: serine protease [Actinomycetota bacterium]
MDSYNRPDLQSNYDITQVDFGLTDSDPNSYRFFLDFAVPMTASRFSDGLASWAGILLDTNLDGKTDYRLETPSTPYSGATFQDGVFVSLASGSPIISSTCKVRTFTNLDANAAWIGFTLPKTCISIGSILGVDGFSDWIAGDDKSFDFAPDTFWNVSISTGSTPNTSAVTSSNNQEETPTQNFLGNASIDSPSTSPADLVSLSSSVAASVVTVLCGSGLGSGWAINADLSSSNIASGYKSYIITNHHVIADCVVNRNISIILADQTKVSAFVFSWDEANDVAGVLTSTSIKPLNWRGPPPQQGWWSGIIGSPLGIPGVLTTGIISSVDQVKFVGTTTSPINHGNSGGPVFDRTGRVIGLATAKYVDSEGFGIFQGTPLLCGKILVCISRDQIWFGSVTSSPTPTPSAPSTTTPIVTPTPKPTLTPTINSKAKQIITDWNLPEKVSISKSKIPFDVSASSDLQVTAISKTESICLVTDQELILVSAGRCYCGF